jgi:hypothetical protein
MEAIMDTKLIAKVKQAVAIARQESSGRVRYSEFIRDSVVKLVDSGVKKSELSGLIDVGVPTILKWAKKESPNYRKISVTSDSMLARGSEFIIILPSGVRIECPSVVLLKDILGVLK